MDHSSEQAASSQHSKAKRFFKKLLVSLMIGLILIITVLYFAGGSNVPLRQGMEQYLSESMGYPASIGTLERVSFYPDISFFAKDVKFLTLEQSDSHPLQIEEIRFSMPFWHYLFGRRSVEQFFVSNLNMQAGVGLPQSLQIDSIEILKPEAEGVDPALEINGSYGSLPLYMKIVLEQRSFRSRSTLYKRPERGPVYVSIGDLEVYGTMHESLDKKTAIDPLHVKVDGIGLKGDVVISGTTLLTITSSLSMEESQVRTDVIIDNGLAYGDMMVEIADADDRALLAEIAQAILPIIGEDATGEGPLAIFGQDLNLAICMAENSQYQRKTYTTEDFDLTLAAACGETKDER